MMEVFVITMSDERFEAAESNLVKAGTPRPQIVRFPATVGKNVDVTDVRIVKSGAYSDDSKWKSDTTRLPSKGAIGCYLSHYKLWKQVLATERDAIIVEDDIVFRVDNAMEEIEKQWEKAKLLGIELLLLGSSNVSKKPSGTPGLFFVNEPFFGCEGYVMSPTAAKHLIAKAMPMSMQVDAFVGTMAKNRVITLGITRPTIAGQNHILKSTIQPRTLTRETLYLLRIHWLPALLVFSILLALGLMAYSGKFKFIGTLPSRTGQYPKEVSAAT